MAWDETVRVLRDGKAALRQMRQSAPLDAKLKDLWRAQHVYVQIVGSRRPLEPWEQPWNIMNDVRDAVIFKKDGAIETIERSDRLSSSRSHWVRPLRPWVLAG